MKLIRLLFILTVFLVHETNAACQTSLKADLLFRFIAWGDTKKNTADLAALSSQAWKLKPNFSLYCGEKEGLLLPFYSGTDQFIQLPSIAVHRTGIS